MKYIQCIPCVEIQKNHVSLALMNLGLCNSSTGEREISFKRMNWKYVFVYISVYTY